MHVTKPIVAVDPGVGGGFAVNTPEGIVLLKMPESLPDICALINQLKSANARTIQNGKESSKQRLRNFIRIWT